jgi:phosphohistidine phosphatase SixA
MKYVFALLLTLLPVLAQANDWDALRQPGAVAIMRHALAPGGSDPARFDLSDCSTQRNLDDRGRAQATRIGQELRDRGITFRAVLTSQWCRCRDTAELLSVGPVRAEPALNSFFGDYSTADAQTEAATQIVANAQGLSMLVTHQVNVTALTDIFPASGEIVVIRWAEGKIEVLGRILIDP